MWDDKAAEAALRINKVEAERKGAIQDVLIKGESVELDESCDAAA